MSEDMITVNVQGREINLTPLDLTMIRLALLSDAANSADKGYNASSVHLVNLEERLRGGAL